MSGAIVVGLAAFVILTTVLAGTTDPADDSFLRALTQRGLSWPGGNDQTMINAGHAVCVDSAGGDRWPRPSTTCKRRSI